MIVCKRDRWYAQFECQREIVALAAAGAVGLDRGVAVLLATSNGDLIENPRHIDAARLHLERAQRIVAKRKRRGKNRGKAVNALARLDEKVQRQRRDHAHKVWRHIVNAFGAIAPEKLQIRGMTRSAKGSIEKPGRNVAKAGLNRALLDAGFGQIAQLIAEKAESVLFVLVN
ncbi:MAG: RNA-guided endonuclease InsQ/TnpB family protein [Vulcanimicrobiaceae bacterium]